jgi:hypothetical protein
MPGVLASALFNAMCFSWRQVQLHLPASQMIQYIQWKNASPNKSNNAKDETINLKDNKLVAESTNAPSNLIETTTLWYSFARFVVWCTQTNVD